MNIENTDYTSEKYNSAQSLMPSIAPIPTPPSTSDTMTMQNQHVTSHVYAENVAYPGQSVQPEITVQTSSQSQDMQSAHPALTAYSTHKLAVPPAITVAPAYSFVAPRNPQPPKTTYTRPAELIRRRGWINKYGYASTLRYTARNPWWIPLATSGMLIIATSLLTVLLICVYGLFIMKNIQFFIKGDSLGVRLVNFAQDPTQPLSILLQFGSVAIMLPALWWTIKILKRQSFGSLSSVYGHLRWSAVFKSMLSAFLIFGAINIGSGFIDMKQGVHYDLHAPSIATLCLTLTIVPIQCIAEEYIFRGMLLQTMGRWLPLYAQFLAPIVPALIFTSLHPYNFIGLTTIFSLGLITGYLAMYLGGLEAGIGMHVANNVTIILMQSVGFYDPSADAISVPLSSAIIDIVAQILIMLIIVWGAQRRHWFDKEGHDPIGYIGNLFLRKR